MTALVLSVPLILGATGRPLIHKRTSLCLRQSDVPAGLMLTTSRQLTNRDVVREDHVPPAVLKGWGRIGGCETVFARTPYQPRGLYKIVDDVSEFHSVSGPVRWDSVFVRTEEKAKWAGASFTALPGIHVGASTTALTATTSFRGNLHRIMVIYFRSRVFAVDMEAVGFASGFDAGEVVALARKINARLAYAHS